MSGDLLGGGSGRGGGSPQHAAAAGGLLRLTGSKSHTAWMFPCDRTLPGEPLGDWPLRLVQSKAAGRYLTASRDLQAGELVCMEDPFVQTVHDALQDAVCHQCYALIDPGGVLFDGAPLERQTAGSKTGNPETCRACAQVRYCSATCARAGAAAHAAECEVLQAIAASGNERMKSGVRGLRLFIRLVRRAAREPEAFAHVEALAEHYTGAPAERRRFLEGVAAQINKLVPPEARMEPTRLAQLVSRVHTNLHAIADMAGVQYGSGLYPRYGHLINHSCDPNAAVSFHGATWRLHVTRPVRAGEEVSISCARRRPGASNYTACPSPMPLRHRFPTSLIIQPSRSLTLKAECYLCSDRPSRRYRALRWPCRAPGSTSSQEELRVQVHTLRTAAAGGRNARWVGVPSKRM